MDKGRYYEQIKDRYRLSGEKANDLKIMDEINTPKGCVKCIDGTIIEIIKEKESKNDIQFPK